MQCELRSGRKMTPRSRRSCGPAVPELAVSEQRGPPLRLGNPQQRDAGLAVRLPGMAQKDRLSHQGRAAERVSACRDPMLLKGPEHEGNDNESSNHGSTLCDIR